MQETLKADGRFWYHIGAACMRAEMAVIVWYTYALEEYGNILSLFNHEICCISLVNYNNQFGIITCSKRVMIASNVMTHPQLSYLPIYALDWDYFYFGFYEIEV